MREAIEPNIAIVSSYNDMLSAHQPLERFPALLKQAAREVGAVAQFAGGVPAMCDGVTQGEAGMELSDAEGGTRVTYAADVQVGGLIASVGQRMLGGVSKMMLDQFFTRMTELLAEAK